MQIQQAYDILKDPLRRQDYDRLSEGSRSDDSTRTMVEHYVELTLKELYSGTQFKATHVNGRQFTVDVPKGTTDGTRFVVRECGVIFVIKEMPDKLWARDGNDLRITFALSTSQFTHGFTLQFDHLDGRPMRFVQNEPLTRDTHWLVTQEGFSSGGNLHIHFVPNECATELSSSVSSLPTHRTIPTLREMMLVPRPHCHCVVYRPVGECEEHVYSYCKRYRWTCCGSQSQHPAHHY